MKGLSRKALGFQPALPGAGGQVLLSLLLLIYVQGSTNERPLLLLEADLPTFVLRQSAQTSSFVEIQPSADRSGSGASRRSGPGFITWLQAEATAAFPVQVQLLRNGRLFAQQVGHAPPRACHPDVWLCLGRAVLATSLSAANVLAV